ncbi:MAG: hypothetical protein J0L77_01440 [Alphaproteobacteria bacterium]|nr:hypothetical protein [Alphaproteobacteria bacterium]
MYTEQYKTFQQNVVFAARTFHCYLIIGEKAATDKQVYNALNNNARFWSDYNYIALQTVIIFLGKIFDTDNNTRNITKMLKAVIDDISYFNKFNLKERKLKLSGEFEGINEYINNAHELSREDIKEIKQRVKKARGQWNNVKPLRDKIYAHNQNLNEEERVELYKKVKYSDLKDILQILLNVAHSLEQAELNGRRPDFNYNYEGPIRVAEKEVDNLLMLLIKGMD